MHLALDRQAFEKRFGNLYRALYCGHDACRASFRNDDWTFLLTARRFLDSQERFEALASAVRPLGDEEIVITEIEGAIGHTWSTVISCDFCSYLAAMESKDVFWLLGLNTAIFGRSGKWAAITDQHFNMSLGYTIFGGESGIVDNWAKRLGGIAKLRDEFLKSFDLPPTWPQVTAEKKITLLSDVGWL